MAEKIRLVIERSKGALGWEVIAHPSPVESSARKLLAELREREKSVAFPAKLRLVRETREVLG